MGKFVIALVLFGSASLAGSAAAAPVAPAISDSGWEQAGRPVPNLSPEQRRQRAERIRDAAAAAGLENGVLLAGIGQVETGFAHCWSEATWACKGPASASCDGGPVIAGSADGPCVNEQGGLGMFQFDSGTYQDTINTYGPDIVTIEGNVAQVVPFLVTRAIESVDGVSNEDEALAWMNSIPIVDGDPDFEAWVYFVSWRYNGCKGCTSQENKYRDGTHLLLDELGADFWASAEVVDDCALVPAAGAILEEDDACTDLRGPLQYWRTEAAGHEGGLRWTATTDQAEASNYARWRLPMAVPGRYELSVYTDGGGFATSRQAAYEVVHAEGMDVVVIDQSATEGWQSLGLFQLDADSSVRVADNTGEPWAEQPAGLRVAVDALRIEPASGLVPGDGDNGGDLSAGCATGGGSSGGAALLLVAVALGWRRRRLG